MVREATISNTWLIAVAYALEALGTDVKSLFVKAGLSLELLSIPNGRHPAVAMGRLWTEAIEQTGDPCLGLRAAQYVQPTTYLSLGLAILSSETLEDAMRRGVRFSRIVSDAAEIECTDTKEGLLQTWKLRRFSAPAVPMVDLLMASTLKMGHLMTGAPVKLARIWRRHTPPPEIAAKYLEFFGTQIEFGAKNDAFLVPHAIARQRLPMANPTLALESDAAVQAYLARFDGSLVADRVRQAIIQKLPAGEPQRSEIAHAVHLGEKTLQRRLSEEGTSFVELVNETRKELAQRYVADANLPLAEVAFRLGFAEQSGFTRAFKRWTGLAPAEFREGKRRPLEAR